MLQILIRNVEISIHPPREGWDVSHIRIIKSCYDFNPPTP